MDWLEILIPLIFALVYILGNIFGKKQPAEDQEEGQGKRGQPQEGGQDPGDLQRRIQEEIRRKIRERQGGSPTPAESAETPGQQPTAEADPPRYDPFSPEQGREAQSPRRSWSEPEPEPEPLLQPETDRSSYEDRIQEQLQEIEATRKRASELQQKAREVKMKEGAGSRRGEVGSSAYSQTADGSRRHAKLRQAVLGLSRDPDAARKAILYMEVLGTPVGMRRDGKMAPLWES